MKLTEINIYQKNTMSIINDKNKDRISTHGEKLSLFIILMAVLLIIFKHCSPFIFKIRAISPRKQIVGEISARGTVIPSGDH